MHTACGIFALCNVCTVHKSTLNQCTVQTLQRAKIPHAVCIQYFLLKMGMLKLVVENNSMMSQPIFYMYTT
jgi:hypothetical protein